MSAALQEDLADEPSSFASLADAEKEQRILIVDDDEMLRSLFSLYLSERYLCATARNYEEAMAQLNCETFALVISDIIMPGRGGVELLREISTRFPGTAVVIVSGVDRTQRVLDAVRLGVYDYLIKPVELDVLGLTVERVMERRALLRAAQQYKLDLERRNAELHRNKVERECLQAQIVQSEKMASLGQLAAGVAHELNNPAGFLYGNMEILDECAQGLERLLAIYEACPLSPSDAEQVRLLKEEIDYTNTLADLRSIIADCRDGAERIRDVVQNLRTFSRLGEAEFKKVDIHEGLESTLRLLARFYNSGHITLRRDYVALPLVDCYAGQLNQVWLNLLINAAYAVKDGGEVHLTTRRKGETVVVSVGDNGCGIAPEHLSKIFDPFFTTKPVGEGTGLGLSVTYSIIERHQGSITVESQPGQGTIFTVALPIDARLRELEEDASPNI